MVTRQFSAPVEHRHNFFTPQEIQCVLPITQFVDAFGLNAFPCRHGLGEAEGDDAFRFCFLAAIFS
jgi:hypothetical protein